MIVFISSTFDDLVDHRQAVDAVLGRLKAQFRGMEVFGARPHDPKHACMSEIASSDIFIGIYAHRYGWVPDGDDLSITEQEFDEARRLKKPCYCYVVDPEFAWSPKHMELAALDKIKRFHAKVGMLVRSKFTTPDNLAKQVAADFVAASAEQNPNRSGTELVGYLRTRTSHEVATTIGTKFIKDLYVGRSLERSLDLNVQQSSRTTAVLGQLSQSVESFQAAFDAFLELAVPAQTQKSVRSQNSATLKDLGSKLATFSQLKFSDKRLNYPAHDVNKVLTSLGELLTDIEHSLPLKTPQSREAGAGPRSLSAALQHVTTQLAEVARVLKPIYLIVDRAGGGKTNLLCHLSDLFSENFPVFFFAAKSIPEPSEESIVRYIASVYPLGPDPIAEAIRAKSGADANVIIVIDGINEHPYTKQFNSAIKAFVRRYYECPVRFIISCRDIYWKYFEDDWWTKHSAFVSKNALYQFTSLEYRSALPLYLNAFDIMMNPVGEAAEELRHPLLLRFFCEAYRGTPASPTKIGKLSEIRLLELFDAYCGRKFEQIRAKLGLLDADEIYNYLKIIALAILDNKNRSLPITLIAKMALKEFGERSIRTSESRYVQILDEDILIEERPHGDLSETFVNFVYDEFMEYMIARAIWPTSIGSDDNYTNLVISQTDRLLAIKDSFVSVAGIVLYLGEMLFRISERHLVEYLEKLIIRKCAELVCDLGARISTTHVCPRVFLCIVNLHRNGARKDKHLAWQAIEKMGASHWHLLREYLATFHSGGNIDAVQALCLVRRIATGMDSSQLQAFLGVIREIVMEVATGKYDRRDITLATARNVAALIYDLGHKQADEVVKGDATQIIDEIRKAQK